MASTPLAIYDETIPFYQLVVSGLFDYSCEEINGTKNKGYDWYLAKALETGSNLSFVVSAEDTTILLDTDYTSYYQADYKNCKDNIVEMSSIINSTDIAAGKLVYHMNIGKNVADVKYELKNGNIIELYVNSTNQSYVYNDVTIPAYGFVKVQ